MNPSLTLQTKVFLVLFFLVYAGFMTRSAVKSKIDIYDYIILSCVALLPLSFVVAPGAALRISRWLGVAFPFVILFGLLFVVIFAYLYHLLNQINRQAQLNKRLVQEISLLKASMASANDDVVRRPAERADQGGSGN